MEGTTIEVLEIASINGHREVMEHPFQKGKTIREGTEQEKKQLCFDDLEQMNKYRRNLQKELKKRLYFTYKEYSPQIQVTH